MDRGKVPQCPETGTKFIAHEAIDYERAFPIGGADHKGMPEDVAFIDERVGADALSLAEILERTAGSEAFAAHLELLSIAGCMQLVRLVLIDIGQVHLIHSFDHSIVCGADIVERKSPINDVFQFGLSHAR